MKTDNVISAKQKTDRTIVLEVSDPFDGSVCNSRYSAIRGGLTWPTVRSPAYFCVVGQKYIIPSVTDNLVPCGSRVLLTEYKSDQLSLSADFYRRIIDTAEQFNCRQFYVDMPEERFACGYKNDFNNFAKERNSKVSLRNAYDAENFMLGLSRIKSSIDKEDLIVAENSILFEQLRNLTRDDLENSPEETFFAINAMRHVIGSYYRSAPVIRNINKLDIFTRYQSSGSAMTS